MKHLVCLLPVALSGCVFSASLDELPESEGNNTVDVGVNNIADAGLDTGSDADVGVDPECNLETELSPRSALGRLGMQVDWRNDQMVAVVDVSSEYLVFLVDEDGVAPVSLTDVESPTKFGEGTGSFDVALMSVDPPRFLLAESRGIAKYLSISTCNAAGTCSKTRPMPDIETDNQVQVAFVPAVPPAVMIGYATTAPGVDKSEYSSRFVNVTPPYEFKTGQVFTRLGMYNVEGIDFSHVEGNRFSVAGGGGFYGFYGYVDDRLATDPTGCGFGTPLLTPYKTKTQRGQNKALYRTGTQGLFLSDCATGVSVSPSNSGIIDFDFVPVDGGDFATWTETTSTTTTVSKGAFVEGNTLTTIDFGDTSQSNRFVRMGRIGDEIVIVLAGSSIKMIRGTKDQILACYGN
ncbi:MAG: hypothetical protein R3E66_15070 [bacterium]